MAFILTDTSGRCFCSCADKCICDENNVGSGYRCTEEQIRASGHEPIRVADKKSVREMQNYTCIDGREKGLKVSIKCMYED